PRSAARPESATADFAARRGQPDGNRRRGGSAGGGLGRRHGKETPFTFRYAPAVKEHLKGIERKHHAQIHSEIETQLLFDPERETRNRKPLERPIVPGAEWELRLGPDNRYRVFYQVAAQNQEVRILAIGVKEKDRLVIPGEEFQE